MDDMIVGIRHIIGIFVLISTITIIMMALSYSLHTNRTQLNDATLSLDQCFAEWDLVPTKATLNNVCVILTNTTSKWIPYPGGRFFVCDSNDTKTIIT